MTPNRQSVIMTSSEQFMPAASQNLERPLSNYLGALTINLGCFPHDTSYSFGKLLSPRRPNQKALCVHHLTREAYIPMQTDMSAAITGQAPVNTAS